MQAALVHNLLPASRDRQGPFDKHHQGIRSLSPEHLPIFGTRRTVCFPLTQSSEWQWPGSLLSLCLTATAVSVRDRSWSWRDLAPLSVCQPQGHLQLPSRLLRRSPTPHYETQLRCPDSASLSASAATPSADRASMDTCTRRACISSATQHCGAIPRTALQVSAVPQQRSASSQQDTTGLCSGCTRTCSSGSCYPANTSPRTVVTSALAFCGSAARVFCQDLFCATA